MDGRFKERRRLNTCLGSMPRGDFMPPLLEEAFGFLDINLVKKVEGECEREGFAFGDAVGMRYGSYVGRGSSSFWTRKEIRVWPP